MGTQGSSRSCFVSRGIVRGGERSRSVPHHSGSINASQPENRTKSVRFSLAPLTHGGAPLRRGGSGPLAGGVGSEPGRAVARPDGSRQKEDQHGEHPKARGQVDLHIQRYSCSRGHRHDPSDCDAPHARKGCGVSAPRCALTGARGSIGPAFPGRPGLAGIGLARTPEVPVPDAAATGWVPDVRRRAGAMGVATRLSPGRRADHVSSASQSRVLRGAA